MHTTSKHTFCLFFWTILAFSIQHITFAQISWRQTLRQDDSWYGSSEAIRIADQVLLYQKDCGGWAKNIDMAAPLTEEDKKKLIAEKPDKSQTGIDNGATFTQLRFLAKVYHKSKEERFLTSFNSGVKYLLAIQYDNGGFPQFPFQNGYKLHITYNDNAMIGVMDLFKDITDQKTNYNFVDELMRSQVQNAAKKGLDCILKTQIIVDGNKTVWCAQHDRDTLKPAPARTYELISLSGSESVKIVQYLMRIENPNNQIIDAIESAVSWFEESKLTGIKLVRKQDESSPRGYDRIIIEDKDADPLWARFFEIGTNKPIFCGRDGIKKDTLAEIEYERRNGYSWYTGSPNNLLTKDYPKWKAKQK